MKESLLNHSQLSPIFVVGAPRSGTTLTARILGRHKSIVRLGESHFFEDVWTRRKQLGDLKTETSLSAAAERTLTVFGRFAFTGTQKHIDRVFSKEKLITDALAMGGSYAGLYGALMQGLADSVHRPYFCDDTPKHLYYLHDILQLFPRAKVVACIRDPRAFLSSYKNYWKRMRSSYETSRVQALYHPVITSMLWNSSANLVHKYTSEKVYSNQVLLVKYEDLVTQPEAVVGKLCDFIGVDYADSLLDISGNNSSFDGAQEESGIFTSSVDRWRTSLQSDEVWWAQAVNRKHMKTYHYMPERVKPRLGKLAFELLSAPWSFTRALYVNSRRRGPVIGYVLRRFLAIFQR
jgi:hypothetical protein